jgi:hypothetical protein
MHFVPIGQQKEQTFRPKTTGTRLQSLPLPVPLSGAGLQPSGDRDGAEMCCMQHPRYEFI